MKMTFLTKMNVLRFQQTNVVDQRPPVKIGVHYQFRHFHMTLTLFLDAFVVFANYNLIFTLFKNLNYFSQLTSIRSYLLGES